MSNSDNKKGDFYSQDESDNQKDYSIDENVKDIADAH